MPYIISTLYIILKISDKILFLTVTKGINCVMCFYPALFAIQVETEANQNKPDSDMYFRQGRPYLFVSSVFLLECRASRE